MVAMTEIDIRTLLWECRTECPGVPEPTLYMAYVTAMREHLRKSLGIQISLSTTRDFALTTPQTNNFPLMTPSLTGWSTVQPMAVQWVVSGAKSIIPFITRADLELLDADWINATTAGLKPDYWTMVEPGKWFLYKATTTTVSNAFIFRIAVMPDLPKIGTDGALTVYEEQAVEFADHWTRGTLAKLLKIPGKDWSNPQLALMYRELFEQDIREAKSRAGADFGRPKRSVQYGGLDIGGASGRLVDDYGK